MQGMERCQCSCHAMFNTEPMEGGCCKGPNVDMYEGTRCRGCWEKLERQYFIRRHGWTGGAHNQECEDCGTFGPVVTMRYQRRGR